MEQKQHDMYEFSILEESKKDAEWWIELLNKHAPYMVADGRIEVRKNGQVIPFEKLYDRETGEWNL